MTLAAYLPIGSGAQYKFGLHPDYVNAGPRYIYEMAHRVRAATDITTLFVWCPFGQPCDGTGRISHDMPARLLAEGGNYARLVSAHARWMRQLVVEGFEVIEYVGALSLDAPTFSDPVDCLNEMFRNDIAPIMAGVQIAHDSSVDYLPGSRELDYIDLLGALTGKAQWIETRPNVRQPWHHHRNVVCDDATWRDWQHNPDYANVKLTGRVLRTVKASNGAADFPAAFRSTTLAQARAVIADGHIAAVEGLELAVSLGVTKGEIQSVQVIRPPLTAQAVSAVPFSAKAKDAS